jgi:hypothetical protein
VGAAELLAKLPTSSTRTIAPYFSPNSADTPTPARRRASSRIAHRVVLHDLAVRISSIALICWRERLEVREVESHPIGGRRATGLADVLPSTGAAPSGGMCDAVWLRLMRTRRSESITPARCLHRSSPM